MNARKIATSVPARQYEALERARRKLKLNRSEAVQRALDLWLASHEADTRVEQYVKAYLAHPEDARESAAYVKAWSKDLPPEAW